MGKKSKRLILMTIVAISLLYGNTALAAGSMAPSYADAKWRARYWNNRSLSGNPVLERDESDINYDWGDRRPYERVDRDDFSARWTRKVSFQTGTYRFSVTADDGVRLWVDDQLIIDRWYDHPAETYIADISLSSGDHRIKMEYYENTGQAVAKLSWQRVDVAGGVWKGRYYNNRNLSGDPVLERDDPAIDFNWGTRSPAGAVRADDFSVRWTRTANFQPGTYRFTVMSDDGVRVWVDDRLIIDRWYDHPAETYVADIALSAGDHRIKMEYYDSIDQAVAKLGWNILDPAIANWKGEYFSNVSLSGMPILVRDDAAVNFDWGLSGPGSGVGTDLFSARWTRSANFQTGTYRFTTTSDDGVRVWVDDRLIIDRWYNHPAETHTADIPLAAGDHRIKMEYYENTGQAVATLSWSAVGAEPPSSTSMTGIVTPGALNLRSGPSTGHRIIGFAYRGQTVTVLGRNAAANWAFVDYRGTKGWMAAWYLNINGNLGSLPVVEG